MTETGHEPRTLEYRWKSGNQQIKEFGQEDLSVGNTAAKNAGTRSAGNVRGGLRTLEYRLKNEDDPIKKLERENRSLIAANRNSLHRKVRRVSSGLSNPRIPTQA